MDSFYETKLNLGFFVAICFFTLVIPIMIKFAKLKKIQILDKNVNISFSSISILILNLIIGQGYL